LFISHSSRNNVLIIVPQNRPAISQIRDRLPESIKSQEKVG